MKKEDIIISIIYIFYYNSSRADEAAAKILKWYSLMKIQNQILLRHQIAQSCL